MRGLLLARTFSKSFANGALDMESPSRSGNSHYKDRDYVAAPEGARVSKRKIPTDC